MRDSHFGPFPAMPHILSLPFIIHTRSCRAGSGPSVGGPFAQDCLKCTSALPPRSVRSTFHCQVTENQTTAGWTRRGTFFSVRTKSRKFRACRDSMTVPGTWALSTSLPSSLRPAGFPLCCTPSRQMEVGEADSGLRILELSLLNSGTVASLATLR